MVSLMNKTKFNKLIENFDPKEQSWEGDIKILIEKYPYFQLPRFFHTKSLKDQNNATYDTQLNRLALYTHDRGILKKYMESDFSFQKKKLDFDLPDDEILEKPNATDKDVIDEAMVLEESKTKKKSTLLKNKSKDLNLSTKNSKTKDSTLSITPNKKKSKKKSSKKNVSQSIETKSSEQKYPIIPTEDLKLSFTDWISFIEKKQDHTTPNQKEENIPLSDKLPIIDKFIEADPKISPVGKNKKSDSFEMEDHYSDQLMTETLAKLLIKQKKYKKAMRAYKILSLKYPEKNVFFAEQIQEIKNLLQQ